MNGTILLSLVLLLILHCCHVGESQSSGSSQPILALLGDDVTLPCHLEPAQDLTGLTVEWSRPDLEPSFVHLERDSVDLESEKNPEYRGRTSLSSRNLVFGDASLKVSGVKVTDAGTYRCFIPDHGKRAEVEVTVGSESSPVIGISRGSRDEEVLVQCSSGGWYPEPEVLWLDGEGQVLSAGPPETVRGPDDLYTVSSRVTVEKRHSNSFTCRVHQKDTNLTREAQVDISVSLFMVQPSLSVRLSICLLVSLMTISAAFLMVWRGETIWTSWCQPQERKKLHEIELEEMRMRRRFGNSLENLLEAGGGGGGGEHDMRIKKLEERLEDTEGEIKHANQMITTLKKQKEDLKNQREKLISLMKNEERLIVGIEKDDHKKRFSDQEKKKEKREVNLQNLVKSKEEHEKMLKKTEELLETTESLIVGMTEKKGKLEREVEMIKKILKETEREEVEMKNEAEKQETEMNLQSEEDGGEDPPTRDPE